MAIRLINRPRGLQTLWVFVVLLPLIGCAVPEPDSDPILIPDRNSGYLVGTAQSAPLVYDPAFMEDRRIKLTVRNITGDPLFDPFGIQQQVRQALNAKGYEESEGVDGFGAKLDIVITNVRHITTMRAEELSDLANAYQASQGPIENAAGMSDAMTFGYMARFLGRFVRKNVYYVEAHIRLVLRDKKQRRRKVVSFSRSGKLSTFDDMEAAGYETPVLIEGSRVLVAAGGDITNLEEVSQVVRDRLANMLANAL